MGLFLPGFRFIIRKLSNFNARITTPPTPYAAEITISATNLAVLTTCLIHIAVTTQGLLMPSREDYPASPRSRVRCFLEYWV